jgi:hypothetical protein
MKRSKKAVKKKVKTIQSNDSGYALEELIDYCVMDQFAEFSPTINQMSFVIFSTLIIILISAGTNSRVVSAFNELWNHIEGASLFSLGATQLSDERKHDRTRRKVDGLCNIASGMQLMICTVMNATLFGMPMLEVAFGVSFIQSLVDLYQCYRRKNEPRYWLQYIQSELVKVNEELSRVNAISKAGWFRFFLGDAKSEESKNTLQQQSNRLNKYIADYNRDGVLSSAAKLECKKELHKTVENCMVEGMAFISVAIATVMSSMTTLPALICIALASAMTLSEKMGLIDKVANRFVYDKKGATVREESDDKSGNNFNDFSLAPCNS